MIDDYGFALERATAIAELENAAKKAGLEITPQLSEQIRQLATAYATATVESEKLAESQDKARQQADDLKDLGKDVLGGFINDLRNGVDAAEALEGALQKVADKLLDMALNNLIAGLFGGGFGGGGLLSLFGFAKGGIAAHGKPQPLPRFAKGGVARSASIFGESTAYITDVPVTSQAMANQIAKAEMERYARQFCKGSCSVRGDASIKAGSMLDMSGLPQGQNGSFYVVASRHVISVRTGYTTEVSFCSNTMGS